MVHVFNANNWEAGSLSKYQGQPGLQSKDPASKINKQTNNSNAWSYEIF